MSKKKICDGHYIAPVRVLSSSGVAPYNDATLEDLKTKHHFKPPPSLGEYIASAPLTPLVKPGGGIRHIAFGVGVAGGSEAILHFMNRLIEAFGDDVGLSMLLVDFKNAFNLVDREGDPLGPLLFSLVLHPLICKIRDSFSLSLHAWYLDDGTIVGDTMVVGKVLELITEDGPVCGLHLNVDKTKVFWPKEDPRSRLAAKTIGLMDVIAKINDPQCELLLLRSCMGISRLYFTMRTCPSCVFESAQRSFDVALRSFLERYVTASGPGFGDWQWRLATLPFAFGGLGVYSASDVLNYAFLASRLQSAGLQTKLLRHTNMLLYSWDGGLDVCVDLTGSSPLTQTGMVDFVPGQAVIDVAQRKRGKYMAKCADIGYEFLPFSFSSLEELEADAVTLLKRIRKFSMTQDIGARSVVHIFNMISFAIAKGLEAHIVSRLPSNLL
nr:hypothetical protein [Tanacetum cinerariifolium]